MRKLMWFSVGFAAACALGAYAHLERWLLFVALGCLLGAANLAAFGKGKRIIAVLLGMAVAACWYFAFEQWTLRTPRQYDGQEVSCTITATDYTWETEYGSTGDGKVALDGRSFRVRFYLSKGQSMAPGDRARGRITLYYTLGGVREMTHHPAEGIFLLAYCEKDISITRAEKLSWRDIPAVLRSGILQLLEQAFPADTLAFAKALLLGDTTGLAYEQDTAFKTAGIRHVVAVSGLHVSILFGLVYFLTGKRRTLSVLLGIPVLFLFAAVAGFTPSVNRACIMQGLMLLAMLVRREYDPLTALAAAVSTMLAINPMAVTSVSLQLSAGCMVGILLFANPIREYLLDEKHLGPASGKGLRARLIRWFAGSVSVTLGAMSVTMPLCALYFGSISLVGILTNLLTLWFISYIFYGIMAACALGALWPLAGSALGWLVSWGIRAVEWISALLARVPLAAVYTRSIYITLWLIFVYVLLAIFLKSKQRPVATFVLCILMGLFLALGASWLEPRLDSYRVSVLDVGQGQCILVQSKGENYLVDCGGDDDARVADLVAETLLSQGVRRLDGIILTHYDRDHAGAVPYLLTRLPVRTLYLPDTSDDSGLRDTLTQTQTVRPVTQNLQIDLENARLRLFPAANADDGNESSLCILFQAENCDILITGDRSTAGEEALLQQMKMPKLEILVAGHHGAKSSTGEALLEATRPEVAVISVGKNSYGHPSKQVLERLKKQNCVIWRTDKQGTLIIRG